MGAWSCYASACGVPMRSTEALLGAALPLLAPRDMPVSRNPIHTPSHDRRTYEFDVSIGENPALVMA